MLHTGMPKDARPILDDSALDPAALRRQQSRVRARAARIRRAAGEPTYPGSGRLIHSGYGDAVFVCLAADRARDARRAERATRQAFRKALPAVVRGLRQAHDLPLAPPAPPRLSRALEQRRRRLLALAPPGASADVWVEIVDHFGCCCGTCGALASRAQFLLDGTPFPACAKHGTRTAGSARNVQAPTP